MASVFPVPDVDVEDFDYSRPLFMPYGLTCETWHVAATAIDRHNEIELNYVQEGMLEYTISGKKLVLPAASLLAFWAVQPHQVDRLSMEQPYFVVTIPLPLFLRWQLPQHLVHTLLSGVVVIDSQRDRYAMDMGLLQQWRDDLATPNPATLVSVQLEMESRLRRLAFTTSATEQGEYFKAAEPCLLGKVEQMALFAAEHCTEPIQASEVSRAVGLHPNYAASIFRRAFGITLHQYLTENRIYHAQNQLATTDAKILDVSLDSGFRSISRFNAAFRRICGCTPRQYRTRFRMVQHRGR